MRHIVIREMKESDIPHVVEIENISFSTPWSSHSFLREIYKPYSISMVALIGDRILGYICAEMIIDEAHILNLAVHPDFRRMGVGSLLVSRLLEEVERKGCRYIYLEVRTSNLAAKRLYERFNFKVVGVRRHYYVHPDEDALIMMLELSH
jgi:ribosomal-protein-alanine N-acetyltransferase